MLDSGAKNACKTAAYKTLNRQTLWTYYSVDFCVLTAIPTKEWSQNLNPNLTEYSIWCGIDFGFSPIYSTEMQCICKCLRMYLHLSGVWTAQSKINFILQHVCIAGKSIQHLWTQWEIKLQYCFWGQALRHQEFPASKKVGDPRNMGSKKDAKLFASIACIWYFCNLGIRREMGWKGGWKKWKRWWQVLGIWAG